MAKTPDPTKDAKFQDVIQHFLKTPPKPFTPKAKAKTNREIPRATKKPKTAK